MDENKDTLAVKNSMFYFAIRSSLPFPTLSIDEFAKNYQNKIIRFLKGVMDSCDLTIEEMLTRKEISDHITFSHFAIFMNEDFAKHLRREYPELYRSSIPKGLRQKILERDNWRCQYCGIDLKGNQDDPIPLQVSNIISGRKVGAEKAQVDHIKPKRSGGKETPDNLVASCWRCNLGKKDYDQFVVYQI